MIGYFNFRPFGDEYLITNDLGRFAFLSKPELGRLVRGDIDPTSELGIDLCEKGFLLRGSTYDYVTEFAPLVRGMKKPLLSPTSLHIFVVSNACNLNCVYCQARDLQNRSAQLMDEETAMRAVDVALSSPTADLSFEFQGGEPLLNFPIIRKVIERAEELGDGRDIAFSVVTNLTLLTEEMLSFFSDHGVGISTSLDGARALHDANRPFFDGGGSFDSVCEALSRVRSAGLHIGAIQTTTKASLRHASEIVDTYCSLGFDSIFLRPLTPLGLAHSCWDAVGYTASEFGEFYRAALSAILKQNSKGYVLREGHASLLLEKIWFASGSNYMEQRSPCGAGVGQMAYHVNGDVFTCDEGRMLYEMGDASFRLGNVHEYGYRELISSSTCRATCAASTLESLPSCCDCAYQPYCGVCPVINIAHDSDLIAKEPNGYRCGVYSGIFDAVFDIIHQRDEGDLSLLRTWFD